MSEPPLLVQNQTVARVRPGANGVLVQSLAEWSEPFEIITKAEAPNQAAAYDLYDAYRQLVGTEAVDIVWCNISLATYGHLFFPLHVAPLKIRRIVHGVGLNGQYFAECICRWRIQPIEYLTLTELEA